MKLELIALTCAVQLLAVDGDTLLCDSERVRLRGFDTPELHKGSKACQHKAVKAWWRLTQILDAPGWRLVPKRTRDGRMARDKYRRILATLWDAQGRDVADVMVEEGLARRYTGGRRKAGC